jgi:hypothetical protein
LRDIFEAAIADRAILVVSELDDAQPEAVEHLQPLGRRRVDVRAALHQPPARIRIGAETSPKGEAVDGLLEIVDGRAQRDIRGGDIAFRSQRGSSSEWNTSPSMTSSLS